MSIIRSLSLCVLALICGQGQARTIKPPIITFCPMGLFDICRTAPQPGVSANTGTIWHKDCFQSGGWLQQVTGSTSWVGARPPGNKPGCDFPIGPLSDIPPVADPTPSGGTTSAIPGCTIGVASSAGNPRLNCTGTSVPLVISGYELGAAFGHKCVFFSFTGSIGTGGVGTTLLSNHMQNDGGCAAGTNWLTSTSTSPINVVSSDLDGNGLVFGDSWGACTPGTTVCNALSVYSVSHGLISTSLSSIENWPQRPIGVAPDATIGWNFTGNLTYGYCLRNPQAHCEYVLYFPNVAGTGDVNITDNTVVQTTGSMQSGQAVFATSFQTGNSNNWTFKRNLIAHAYYGGAKPSATSVTGTILANTSTFRVTAISGGTIGTGQFLGQSGTCGGIQATLINPKSGQASVGPGGGNNSGSVVPQDWGLDLDITAFTFGGSVDAAGNMTITSPPLIIPAVGMLVTGTGISGGTHITGGSGSAWTVSPAPAGATGPITITMSGVPNVYDGGWKAWSNITCTITTMGTKGFTYSMFNIGINNNHYNLIDVEDNWVDMAPAGAGASINGKSGSPVGTPNCNLPAVFLRNVDVSGLNSAVIANRWVDGFFGGDPGTNCGPLP